MAVVRRTTCRAVPERNVPTIRDFPAFCERFNFGIEKEIFLHDEGQTRFLPNFRAEEALYALRKISD